MSEKNEAHQQRAYVATLRCNKGLAKHVDEPSANFAFGKLCVC